MMLYQSVIFSLLFARSISIHYIVTANDQLFKPTWASLDNRILPNWYDEAKVGIFIHWGVFSVPSFGSEWFWNSWESKDPKVLKFMDNNYKPNFTYQDFARDFTTEFFYGDQWANLLNRSGAKYVVLTSKHHEGYTMWPSKYSFSWNSKDVGPKRDLIGEFVHSIRNKTKLRVGLYHSLLEWYNPIYLQDQSNKFASNNFVVHKVIPEMVELVTRYKPDIFWSDGDWTASDDYWKSRDFLVWLYNESPVKDTVVVNDRWGNKTRCKHGGFFTCSDRYDPGVLQKRKWENAMTIDKLSWGYRRNINIEEIISPFELISLLVRTVSCGGNILINVGPTKEGWISPIFQERLLQLGSWLSRNGESIYGSSPWTYQNDTKSETWYTAKNNAVYALTLSWPNNNILTLGLATKLFSDNKIVVELLGYKGTLQWKVTNKMVQITFPDKAKVQNDYVWALKIH